MNPTTDPSAPSFSPRRGALLLALPLAWLWGVLIHHLQVEWSVNSQYAYGWSVPFLCGYLLWRRRHEMARALAAPVPSERRRFRLVAAVTLIALAYAPTRLIEQANPDWRLMSWLLAGEVIALTLILVRAAGGPRLLAAMAFPIGFFLVAVPWPIPWVEQPLIQGLTRLDAAICAELFGWLSIPVIPHGNGFELVNGLVGIDEACSGIRSFQATLMIALFLGDYYRLSVPRRGALVLAGVSLSVLFNLARMTLLVGVAARQGVAAIAQWHDPAGVTILLGCFTGLWLLGVWLSRGTPATQGTAPANQRPEPAGRAGRPPWRLALGLAGWFVVVEAAVQGWYAWHAARLPAAPQWTVAWPTNAPGFKTQPIAQAAREILRYDEGSGSAWESGDSRWSAVFLRWNPGRAAVHLAQNHTPDVCLTAAGHTLKPVAAQLWLEVNGFRLPFSVNAVTDSSPPCYVFYCLWDDRAIAQGFDTRSLTHANRLAPVWAGQRNPGQRSLELLVLGPASSTDAIEAVKAELKKMLVPDHQP